MNKSDIEKKLEALPQQWRDKLAEVFCEIQQSIQVPICEQVKECETLTSLSPFTVTDTTVSIQFKDEKGVTVTRSFDVEQLINSKLDTLNPSCIEEWGDMSLTERFEALINSSCEDCQVYYTYSDQLEGISSEDYLPCDTNFSIIWTSTIEDEVLDFKSISQAGTVYGTDEMTYQDLAEAIEALNIFQSVTIDAEGTITVQSTHNVGPESVSINIFYTCPQ